MPEIKDPDLFESRLETHLQTWRSAAPPPHLKSRIAAAWTPRRFSYGRPLLAAGICAAVWGVSLIWPGLSLQPVPVLADVDRAMGSVESISFTSTTQTKFRNGTIENETVHNWVQRHPPAITWDSIARSPKGEQREKTLSTEKQIVTLVQIKGQPDKWRVSAPNKDTVRETREKFYIYTHPGTDDPTQTKALQQSGIVLPPWQAARSGLNGKPVWLFTRTFRDDPSKPAQKGIMRNKCTILRLLADAVTHRAVRVEISTTYFGDSSSRQSTSTDFRYNEPPPPGTLDLRPPK